MNQQTSYYLRVPTELNRQLKHLCIETRSTMNDVIVKAIRAYLEFERAAAANDNGDGSPQ